MTMAIRPRTQLVVDITPEFREALKVVAGREFRTVSQTVLMALVEKYPELQDPQKVLDSTTILGKIDPK